MTRRRTSTRPERRYIVVGVRRETPDLRRLGKALLAVVLAAQQQGASQHPDEDSSEGGDERE